eukprot:NODE_1653_length_883_cov_77.724221_g1295_i0.p1 GENE.NODE_1653_length_883_cov_77.724221_g1295_i0~~NODE_1653_length_883_cov_77.724221_g1295_i0.p1  ORF type:complete len:201 (+),score=58.29 NODE_1653_length_883_cov_77.724221_g1295_i0:98-700(+)
MAQGMDCSTSSALAVVMHPTAKRAKELKAAVLLLDQFCAQQCIPSVSVATADTGTKHQHGQPIHKATAQIQLRGKAHEVTVAATSVVVANNVARCNLLMSLHPNCKTVDDVSKVLRAGQKQLKKSSKKRAKQKREDFLMNLFPDCANIEEVKVRMRQNSTLKKSERRKRHREGFTDLEAGGEDEEAAMEEEQPQKKRRKM